MTRIDGCGRLVPEPAVPPLAGDMDARWRDSLPLDIQRDVK